MMRWVFLAIVTTSAVCGQAQVLNVSRDLVGLGIASQNMTPGVPTLDARPLLDAAVQYAQQRSISRIIADPGAYYFLSLRVAGRYLTYTGLHDLVFDLGGSDLYFQLGGAIGFECNQCQRVQFLNFTMDALELPFTQVQVSSVDTANNRILYAPLPGWEPPTNFNTVRNPLGFAEPLYAFAFRGGKQLRSTSRMAVQRPLNTGIIQVVADGNLPWSNPQQISSIQPGDKIVLEARSNGSVTLAMRNCSNIVIRNVSVYYGGAVAVAMNATSDSVVEQVQVIPRPGTDRLVSSNADGIGAVQLGQNLTIQRSRVVGNGDDGISPNSQQLAIVTGQPGARQVRVNRSGLSNFPDGLNVQFIDQRTGFPAVTARIVTQDPPYSTALPVSGSAATLTFDQDIPALLNDFPMVYADPVFRGAGLVVRNNLVQDNLLARGISLWGLLGGTISGNMIRNVNWSGINAKQSVATTDWMTGPVANLTIQRNVIEQFSTTYSTRPSADAFGGIDVLSLDTSFAPRASGSPFQNITVADNFVSTGSFSGIRLQNTNGGSVTGNLLMNVSAAPAANGASAQQSAELSQPLFLTANSNVASTGNVIVNAVPVAAVTSGVSFANSAIAPDSWAAAFGASLAPQFKIATTDPFPTVLDGVIVTIKDSAGIERPARLHFISPQQINFLVPFDCALGAAIVTITSSGAVTGRGGILIDTLAPALFSADGSGTGTALGAAVLAPAGGAQIITPLTQPVDLGKPGDVAAIVLYATGLRNVNTLNSVAVILGGQRLPVFYAGAQGTYAGLDQINVIVPESFRGAGLLNLRVVADGISSNSVNVRIN